MRRGLCGAVACAAAARDAFLSASVRNVRNTLFSRGAPRASRASAVLTSPHARVAHSHVGGHPLRLELVVLHRDGSARKAQGATERNRLAGSVRVGAGRRRGHCCVPTQPPFDAPWDAHRI
eukprot:5139032-Prymnesium_polylepis.3